MEIPEYSLAQDQINRVRRIRSLACSEPALMGVAVIIIPMPIVAVDVIRCPTWATDGVNCYINPVFTKQQNDKQILWLLMHEASHICLGHHVRKPPDVHPMKWNIATDYAINYYLEALVKSGVCEKPDGALLDDKFDDTWTSEAICAYLDDPETIEVRVPGSDEGGADMPGDYNVPGEIWELPDDVDAKKEMADVSARMADASILEESMKKLVGEGAGNIISRIRDRGGEPQPWQHIEHLLRRVLASETTWMRPNRRHLYREIYLPGKSHAGGVVHVCTDTSGSVGQREHEMFFSNMKGLVHQLGLSYLKIATVDYDIHKDENGEIWTTIDTASGDEVEYTARGGGGTSFDPIFQAIEDDMEDIDVLIYMTDGYGSVSVDEPPYPVIWLTTRQAPRFRVKFGEIVDISKKTGALTQNV